MICKECGKHSDKSYSGMCESCYRYFSNGGTVHPIPSPGVLARDEQGKPICHICGRSYTRLGSHVKESHHMTIEEYKERFNLCRNAKTTAPEYSAVMRDHADRNGMPDRLLEAGKGTRIKKGETDKRKGKTCRAQETNERSRRNLEHNYKKRKEKGIPMKRIINGKLYNTATAKEIGAWSNNYNYGDFSYCEETLYLKRTGEYFLYGKGGPMSKYSQSCGQNSWSGGEEITPLTETEAREWAEKHLDADEYIEIFGEPEE